MSSRPRHRQDPRDARAEILHRIATALVTGPQPPTAGSVTGAPGSRRVGYRIAGPLPAAERLGLFADRLRDYQAAVHTCTRRQLATTVTELLDRRSVREVVLPPQLPVDLGDWAGGRHNDAAGAALSTADLDAADAVLTGCAVAIAETGTIVLDSGADQGRRVLTLLPDHHIVVVHADQVVQTVPEAVRRLTPGRPLTWISGPSATSDIELSRVEGVHGPRLLDVVLVHPGGRELLG